MRAKIHTWLQRNKRLSRALSELLELDRTEKSVLREFYLQGQNTLQLPINQTTVSGLITKGILCRAGSIGEQSLAGMLFPVKLAEHVKKHLKRDLIDLPPEPWSTQQIELLIEKRPSFLTEIQDHNELFHKGWPL